MNTERDFAHTISIDKPVHRVRAGACRPLEPLTARDAAERAGLLPRPRLGAYVPPREIPSRPGRYTPPYPWPDDALPEPKHYPSMPPLRARQEGKSYVPSLPDPVRPQFVWALCLALAIGAAVFLFRL